MITKEDLIKTKSTSQNLLTEILGSKVCLFGDDHNMSAGRIWLKDNLEKFSSNYKYLGLEYLPSPEKNLLDDEKELENYLQQNYKDFPGFGSSSIIQLIHEAEKNNLEVFGIEMPPETFDDWTNIENQKERTKFMAERISEKTKSGKVLVLMGADHVEKGSENVRKILDNSVSNILSVVFVGGKKWTIDTEEYWIRQIELAAIELGCQDELFVLKNGNNTFPSDWVIHFPQSEKIS